MFITSIHTLGVTSHQVSLLCITLRLNPTWKRYFYVSLDNHFDSLSNPSALCIAL
jgi:hypothetical protein